jgi:hypothetical protein
MLPRRFLTCLEGILTYLTRKRLSALSNGGWPDRLFTATYMKFRSYSAVEWTMAKKRGFRLPILSWPFLPRHFPDPRLAARHPRGRVPRAGESFTRLHAENRLLVHPFHLRKTRAKCKRVLCVDKSREMGDAKDLDRKDRSLKWINICRSRDRTCDLAIPRRHTF